MIADERKGWTSADWRHWRELRKFVLERDENTCRSCGAKTKVVGRLDYSVSAFEPSNLACECRRCLGGRLIQLQPRREYPGPDQIKRPDEPASGRQRRLLRELGAEVTPELTRAQAAELIPKLVAASQSEVAG